MSRITPANLTFRAFLVLCILNFAGSWLFGLFNLIEPSQTYLQLDIDGQCRSIDRRLQEGGANWQGILQPEGTLFSYAFYGFSLINLACMRKTDTQFRNEVIQKLERLIPQADQCCTEIPFTFCKNIRPTGGIIAAGCSNLLRAGYAILGGSRQDIIQTFHANSKAIAESYRPSQSPFLESFPGLRWPVDNCAALESLRLHDKLYSSSFFPEPGNRWQQWMQNNLDKESGMMIAQVDETGKSLDVPRGCALSWSLAFTPGMAKELDASQYYRFQKSWFIPVLGTTGIREWWPGQEKYSKIQEGPVLFGIGAAASGLGIAATHVHNDRNAHLGLLRGLESISFPSWNIHGEKSYFGQSFLLADVLALWGKTCTIWDNPSPESSKGTCDFQTGSFKWPLILASLISSSLLLLTGFYFIIGLQQFLKSDRNNMDSREKLFASVNITAVLAIIIFPEVLCLWVLLIFMTTLSLENWFATIKKYRDSSKVQNNP